MILAGEARRAFDGRKAADGSFPFLVTTDGKLMELSGVENIVQLEALATAMS